MLGRDIGTVDAVCCVSQYLVLELDRQLGDRLRRDQPTGRLEAHSAACGRNDRHEIQRDLIQRRKGLGISGSRARLKSIATRLETAASAMNYEMQQRNLW